MRTKGTVGKSFGKWLPSIVSLLVGAVVIVFASAAGIAPADAQDARTVRTWRAKCASCHGPDGKAQTEQGRKMAVVDFTATEWQTAKTDDQIREQILNGIKMEKAGVKKEMEAFRDKLSADQVNALIAYVRSFRRQP